MRLPEIQDSFESKREKDSPPRSLSLSLQISHGLKQKIYIPQQLT